MDVRRVGWVVVFAGVAMAALGLVSLGEWWDLSLRLHDSDLQIDYRQMADLEPLWLVDLVRRSLAEDAADEGPPRVEVILGIAMVLVLFGAVTKRIGHTFMFLGVSVGVALTALYVRDWLQLGFVGNRCGPVPMPSTRHDFADVHVLSAQLGLIAALALVFAMRTRESFIVAFFGAAMLAAPMLGGSVATVVIIVAGFMGAGLGVWFERGPSLPVSIFSVAIGVLGALISIVIQHDLRLVESLSDEHAHRPRIVARDSMLTAERCEPAPFAPLVYTRDEVSIMGRQCSLPVDSTMVAEQFTEIIAQRESLGGYGPISFNIEADRTLSLADFFAVLRGFAGTKNAADFFTIVFVKVGDASVWSRPSRHEHSCGLKVMLTDDGLRERDFANFEAVFEAASRGGLKLSVE